MLNAKIKSDGITLYITLKKLNIHISDTDLGHNDAILYHSSTKYVNNVVKFNFTKIS